MDIYNPYAVQSVFRAFTNGASEMDGRTFAKFAKDSKLLDKKLTATDVDLIFAKIKDKTARKIVYSQFEHGLDQFAAKKGMLKSDMIKPVLMIGGPSFQGTKADYVKFHDDKSLYTGVHANGGPSTVDLGKGKINSISELCDRTPADVRGIKKY